jgi:hypothetical protein
MSKRIGEPVKTYARDDAMPSAFIWRKRLYRVAEILTWWREPSEWWNGKATRLFVRVNTNTPCNGTYELCKLGKEWFLYRVID